MLIEKVLIVGGGIGGMAAAIRLAQAGVKVELIDIDPNWKVSGAGVTLSVMTMRALCDLGLAEDLVREGHGHDGVMVFDANENLLKDVESPRLYAPDVPGEGGILRPVLHRIMQQRVRSLDVKVRLGVTIDSFAQTDGGVSVVFSDGGAERYDLLIGADGLFSKTRRLAFPDAPAPTFTGQACWRANFDIPEGWTKSRMYLTPTIKVGFTPCSPTRMYMFLLEHVPDNPWRENHELIGILRGLLAGFGGAVAQIRESVNDSNEVIYRPLETILLSDTWSVGRVVLIGDAVHGTTPHLGAGAGAAVEDAIVLSDLLATSPTIADALGSFDARRIPRASLVVTNSLRLGQMEMAGEPMPAQAELLDRSIRQIAEPYR